MDEQYSNMNKTNETSSSEEEERNSNQARQWPRVIKRRKRTRYIRASTKIDIKQLRATNSSYLSTPYTSNERVLRHNTAMTNTLRVLSGSIIDEQTWNLHLLASVVSGVKHMEVKYEPGMRERKRIRRTEMADTEKTEAEGAREEGEPGSEAQSVPGHRQFDSADANLQLPPRFKPR